MEVKAFLKLALCFTKTRRNLRNNTKVMPHHIFKTFYPTDTIYMTWKKYSSFPRNLQNVKGLEAGIEEHLSDSSCHFITIGAILMMDLSVKMYSANPECQPVANVITKDTSRSGQPSLMSPISSVRAG